MKNTEFSDPSVKYIPTKFAVTVILPHNGLTVSGLMGWVNVFPLFCDFSSYLFLFTCLYTHSKEADKKLNYQQELCSIHSIKAIKMNFRVQMSISDCIELYSSTIFLYVILFLKMCFRTFKTIYSEEMG